MKTGIPNYRIAPAMNDGSVVIRRAAKDHVCRGGIKDGHRRPCGKPITKGSAYVEYYGEAHAYQSGRRYHPDCAVDQGLLERIRVPNA